MYLKRPSKSTLFNQSARARQFTDEIHVHVATRQKSSKCSEDAGGRPRGRRGAMTISALESSILCVISNVWNADFIHSTGPCRSIYRCLSQPCLMDENHVLMATRPMSRKCSEDAGGHPKEKRRPKSVPNRSDLGRIWDVSFFQVHGGHDHFIT